jgi:hypothetical protein
MPFKKINMIIPIFIVILLLALYIFTKSPVNSINRTDLIGPANIIKDTFIVHNNKSDNNSKNDNNSIINNKIRIRNRDNSLLQQYIKNDNLPINNKKEQDPKEFQKMLRDNLEQNVSDVYDTLKNISTSTSVPIANTLINNDKYKGYNNYVSLRTDSYAPVTSIGKQLITAFSSYPIAS